MKSWQHLLGAIASSLTVTVGFATAGQAVTKITFDEVSEGTSLDGQTIKGVTFDYRVDGENSDGAFIGNFGSDFPPLSGNALLLDSGNSVLTLDFEKPITRIQFNADWVCTFIDEECSSLGPDYTVSLFDRLTSSWKTYDGSRSFSQTGNSIESVKFEFNPSRVEEFAIDDLTFNKVGNPEPTTILGTLALGAIGVAKFKKSKR